MVSSHFQVGAIRQYVANCIILLKLLDGFLPFSCGVVSYTSINRMSVCPQLRLRNTCVAYSLFGMFVLRDHLIEKCVRRTLKVFNRTFQRRLAIILCNNSNITKGSVLGFLGISVFLRGSME